MSQPCICPKDVRGRITRTDPRCFDHASWGRHPGQYVVVLEAPAMPEMWIDRDYYTGACVKAYNANDYIVTSV